jgi:ligand-binding sensor domain-containing protein/signal transduction histidine kinase
MQIAAHRTRTAALFFIGIAIGLAAFITGEAKCRALEETNRPAKEFNIASWHTENGLPDGNVMCIEQTPDGYLWVGTFKGLARFDGEHFTVFNARKNPELQDDHIAGLLADSIGRLWIGCDSGDLLCYEQGRFWRPTGVPFNEPAKGNEDKKYKGHSTHARALKSLGIAEDREGGIWFQAGRTNLLRVTDGKAKIYSAPNGLPAGTIYALVSGYNREVWLLAGDGFYRWEKGKWNLATKAAAIGQKEAVFCPAHEHGLWGAAPEASWFDGAGRIFRVEDQLYGTGLQSTPWKPNVQRSQVTALLEDSRGRLWLGMHWNGIFCQDDSGRWLDLQREGPLAQCRVTCLFEDHQGAIWFGTVGDGLHRVTRRSVTAIPLPDHARGCFINTVCAARDGNLWVGTDGAGVYCYANGGFRHFGAAEGLEGQVVLSIFEDSRTNLWCSSNGGLFRLVGGQFQREPFPGSGAGMCMFEDRDANLWLGLGGGLYSRSPNGKYQRHSLPTPSGTAQIRSVSQDRAGNLWLGAVYDGLFCIRSNRVEHFGAAEGLSNPDARSVWCDADGGVWVGTLGGGLFHLVDGRFHAITTADGLPDDTINSIVEDENGVLWMSSYNGYFGCARRLLQRYERGRSPMLACQWLNLADGLHFRICSGAGQPICSRSADGQLWFANLGCLDEFSPTAVAYPSRTADPLIESVLVDGQNLLTNTSEVVRTSSEAKQYEFHYTAPDPDGSAPFNFRYQLQGVDPRWVEAGTRRVAYFNRIPPGHYTFRAMVGGPDGAWRETAQVVSLEVMPRLWERRSVQVAAALALILALTGTAWGVTRARYRRWLERLQAREAMERERRRIAQDLHDDLGTSLTEVSLLSAVARSPSASTDEVQSHLDAIAGKSSDMVKALDEIVWAANPKNDSVRNLANYLSFFAREYLQPTTIRCRLDVPPNLPETLLNAEQRHTLYLAVKEAIANAAKYSGASELWLRVALNEHSLRITVEDNGKGFDPAAPSNRNGLANMQSRLTKLGGRCEIVSVAGKGTRIGFDMPLKS